MNHYCNDNLNANYRSHDRERSTRYERYERTDCDYGSDYSDNDSSLVSLESQKDKYKELAIIFIMIALMFSILLGIEMVGNHKMDTIKSLPREEITVHYGDTVLGIANEHPIDGVDNSMLAKAIMDINHTGGMIYAGETLEIPIQQ